MAAHSESIAVNDEGIVLRTSLPPKPTPATPLRRQQFVCDCMETEPELSTSPSSVVDFPDLPCGILPPALPLDKRPPGRRDAAVRGAVPGVVELRLVDTTDEQHVAVGAADGRAIAAHGRQLQVYVEATSFRGREATPEGGRRVMAALRPMIDSGVLRGCRSGAPRRPRRPPPLSCVPRPKSYVRSFQVTWLCSSDPTPPRLGGRLSAEAKRLHDAIDATPRWLAWRPPRPTCNKCTQKGAYARQAARHVWMIAGM